MTLVQTARFAAPHEARHYVVQPPDYWRPGGASVSPYSTAIDGSDGSRTEERMPTSEVRIVPGFNKGGTVENPTRRFFYLEVSI